MTPTFVIAGRLNREYVLPPSGQPLLDSPGGNLLYAAGGLAVWDSSIGLVGRVGEDYPRQWMRALNERGFDIRGIRTLRELQNVDLRSFIAFTDTNERSHSNAVSHFARRQLTFPKSLLGYQPPDESRKDPREPEPASPSALDVPKDFRDVRYVHICPFDFVSQSQMVNLFKGGSNQTVSLDPAPGYMVPAFWRDLRLVLQGVTIFQPSEDELRSLFWGETNDLWEMARRISEYGPQIVVIKRGSQGQMLYDVPGNHRYELPAYASRMVDPTGAGDAFCGGFLAGFQKTNDPLLSALHGSVSASLKIEGSGPFYELDVMPGLAEARLFALKEMVREV
ncbi:MAG TPA: carbohydrate kinase family protein [Anaerolineales bacterium]|nr:carbohydrate kinase family protein [Anaerolineales bacterium]HMX21287.1 carbohydrate kinase family protein [Anaerolineales bacterium]HMZ45103.1 carbohydrate kinase family protein [Anaerolineales bacterium]HNB88706.1 carbohydrate kinase family protein [Anaerolineales bacterium]HNC91469.1 carbohydrate kinase family protein [Anaerolineales bacterium]